MDLAKKVEVFRSRFHGRQDVYGRGRTTRNAKGEPRLEYSPVCNNIWTDGCHIKRGTGVPCAECETQLWDPVSDQCVEQHVSAHHVHNFYLVLDEGAIRFGAVDFDLKEGREDKGYDFFEVQKFCSMLKARKIAYGIARSTNAGYHVYMFFQNPYPAVRFRAVMYKLFEACGFDQYVKEKIKSGYPEIFPKQDYVAENSRGNGITPPMIEPLIMKGKKCWVDDDDRVIGESEPEGEGLIEAQWSYLDSLPWTDPALFDNLIDKYALKIEDVATLKKRAEAGVKGLDSAGSGTARPYGHVEKVIHGCEAFRDLYQRVRDANHQPSHVEGMALWHLCINTVDGKDWFEQHVKSWGVDQGEVRQLEYSVRNHYRPHSCEKMKEQGICHKEPKFFCAEAAPRAKKDDPTHTDGALEDVIDTEKRLHNPYRFAFSDGAELLHDLIREADALLQLPAEDDAAGAQKEQTLRDLAKRAQALDKPKLRDFKSHVDKLQKALKVPKNRIAPMFKEASEQRFEREQELLREDVTVYEVGSFIYRKRFGDGKFGYFQIGRGKDEILETLLLEMDIIIREERFYTEEGGVTRTVYKGLVRNAEGEKNFEIDSDSWASDVEFQKFFTKLMGGAFSPVRKQLEHIKQAVLGWCEKRNLTVKISSLLTQGFYEGHFLMPSVTVDASGLRPTKAGVLEIGHKDFVKNLDWKILEDDDFKETLRHIKDDFLTAWPADWTFIGLPHTFRPLMRKVMGWQTFPTLFYDGVTGSGKSELTKMLQQFWGDFPSLVNLTSSQKYLEEMAYEFKDCCLVLDDFKNLTIQQRNAVLHQIQYGFDGSSSGKLKRDSSPRDARRNRSTLIMSGEAFIQNQSSVVARTLLVEVDAFDQDSTAETYFRCKAMAKNYPGITPRFLHWLMGREKELLQKEYEDTRLTLYRFAKGRQNASRIAENVAANHLTWKLFTQFMEDSSVISPTERSTLDKRHWDIAQAIYHKMVQRCEEEQEAFNFKSILLSLILSGAVRVEGLKLQNDNLKAPVIGYVPDPADQRIGYYFTDTTLNEVNQVLMKQGTVLQKKAVARQLLALKITKSADPGHQTKQVRKGAARLRVWVIDHVALELIVENASEESASSQKVVELRPATEAFRDSYGLF